MKTQKLLATLLVAGMLFTGCGLKSQNAVITINGHAITQKQYDDLFDKAVAGSPFASMGGFKENPDGMLALMTRQRVLNQLIIQEILDQEAEQRDIKVSGKEVDEAVAKVMDKVGGKEQLMAILKQNGVSAGEFKKDIKNQVRLRKLAQAADKIEVTDKDCEDFYKKNITKFKTPQQVRASHILIAANEYQLEQELTKDGTVSIDKKELQKKVADKMKAQKELAAKVAKEVKADKDNFANYAKKYSDDPGSARQGGDLGFFAKDKMVPEFANAAFAAKPNTITDPVKSQFGYHIIMVTDRKEATTTPYEKAKSDIKETLKTNKEIQALDDLSKAAKEKATIEYSDDFYNPEIVEKKLNSQLEGLKDKMGVPDKMRTKKPEQKKPAPKKK